MMVESKLLNEVTVLGGLEEIVTNIKIVKEGELFSFKDFINDNEIDTLAFENRLIRDDRVVYYVYYKNKIVKGIYQILLQTYNEQPLFSILDGYTEDLKGKRIGYYSSYQNCFYDTRNYMKKPFNFEGVEVKYYGDLLKDISDQVNQKIYNIVNDDINNLNLSKEELELLREKTITNVFLNKCKTHAKECVLNSEDNFRLEYADYEIEIEQYKRYKVYFDDIKLIKALYNKEALIIEEVDNFINDKKNKEYMYYAITKNYYVNKYIEELKQDSTILKLKEIYSVLGDESKKTLNITYKKDNKEMTFKIEGNPHIHNFKEISSYKIINKHDRRKFEDTFKEDWRRDDIELEHIETISYGKKVLYKK